MRRQDSLGVRTPKDLEKKYLSQLLGIKKAMSSYDESIKKTNNTLENFILRVLDNLNNLQNQIDGNITTYFYSGVPSINSLPTSEWNNEDYEKHLGDLYYDKSTGYAYRFSFDNDDYCWIKLSDTDVVEALALANSAKDTADSKRRTFVEEPIPPYDVGDIWFSNGNLYRCKISNEQGSFQSEHWIKAVDYTDDTAANEVKNLLNEFKQEVIRDFLTQSSFTTAIDKINASVKQLEVAVGANNKIFREEPTVPYNKGDIYINGSNIYTCIQDRNEGTYNISDWEISDNPSEIISEAALKIALGLIEQSVKEKIGNEEIGSVISQTAQKIFIESNNFGWKSKFSEMTTEGQLSVWDILVNGGNIELTDDGTENSAALKIKTIFDNEKSIEDVTELSGATISLNFPDDLDLNLDGIKIGQEYPILYSDNDNYLYVMKERIGVATLIGFDYSIIDSKSGTVLFNRADYLYDEGSSSTTKLNEFTFAEDWGNVTSEQFDYFEEVWKNIKYVKKETRNTYYTGRGIIADLTTDADYTIDDVYFVQNYIVSNSSKPGSVVLTPQQIRKYDANKDGVVDLKDILRMQKYVMSGISKSKPGKFILNTDTLRDNLQIIDGDGNDVVSIGLNGINLRIQPNYRTNYNLVNLSSALSFSSDEKMVSTWIDGKPVYRKVIELIPWNDEDYSITHSEFISYEVDTLVRLDGFIYNQHNCYCPLNMWYSSNNQVSAHFSTNDGCVRIKSTYPCRKGYVLVEYTKVGD